MMKRSKLRRIAYSIIDKRNYVTFNKNVAVYWFDTRGHIPRHLWRSLAWQHEHIVMPAIRERRRWPSYKLTGNALPLSMRVDNTLFKMED